MNAMMPFDRLTYLAESGAFDVMLEELLRAGRRLPLPVRLVLTAPEHAPLSALALGIRRITEQTHRPAQSARSLLASLLDHLPSSSRTVTGSPTLPPAVAAIVLRALLALRDQVAGLPLGRNPLSAAEREGVDRAIDDQSHTLYLARLASEGGRTPGLVADPVTSAIILWQLGDRADLDHVIRLPELEFALRRRTARETPGVRALLHVARARTSAAA